MNNETYSYSSIPVLEFLQGLPYNHLTQCYIRSLRPSYIRIIKNGVVNLDGRVWRVTVFLKEDDIIDYIQQEVEVSCYDDIEDGHDLDIKLENLKVKYAN